MKLSWSDDAWEDCLSFQTENKQAFSRVNKLIKDIKRSPFVGLGKPELLKYNLSSLWSRRITDEHRLVYRVLENEIEIVECKNHYERF